VTSAALLEAVREACPRGLWSQGVKLAREGAVKRESSTSGEVVLRVAAPGMAVAATVVLYPGEGEWECDCGSRFDACAHVAAAAIALGQPEAAPLETAATLAYRFEREGGRLFLKRAVVRPDGSEASLLSSLFSIASGRAPGHGLTPSQVDLEIERMIGSAPRAAIETDRLAPLLAALSGNAAVSLDGASVTTSGEQVQPRGLVTSRGDGVRLAVVADPSVTDIPADRLARCGDVLHPLAHTSVAGERWEALPLVRDYAPHELAELVTTMLPALRNDVEVEVRTRKLPGLTHEARPRIDFAIEGEGARLSVLPTLVYGDPPLARVDGDKLVQIRPPAPVRDRRAEKDLVDALRDRLNMMPGRRVQVAGADARSLAERVRAFQRGEDPEARRREALLDLPLAPHFTLIDDEPDGEPGFDLWFETAPAEEGGEGRRVSAASVAAAWQHGLELVPLDGGGWAPLPADFLARHGQRVLDLLAARGERGRVPAVAVPALVSLCDELGAPRPAAAKKLAALLGDNERIPPAALPAGFVGVLRPYQQSGVDWLAFLRASGFGAVLADDMGLGKTVQALAVVDGRTLVVCPTSVLHNWESEIARFRPDLAVSTYHGSRRALDRDADVVLTTYAILRIDRERLGAERWKAVILDEAQAIKNPDSQSAQAAFGLEADFRLAMSGTPIENRLDELWSVCHVTNPGLLGGRSDFQRRVATPIAAGRADAAAFLRDKIRPFVLRRLKRDVAPELPPRTDQVISVELDEQERATYDAVRAASRAEIAGQLAANVNVMQALEALLRLRQAACHPALLPGLAAPPTSSKITCLVEALETAAADGHKALVFSQWTSLLDLVEPHLEAAAIGYTRLDGSTVDRAGVVRTFQDDDGPPVLIASLKAGGTGLNLTAADHVFVLDPWWNPAAEDQAADRAHRIGQDKPVFVYRLVAKDTVEERILDLQKRKRALADAALGEADRAAALTRDDLLALLE
jgi:superfamily II DNA or RNA helicase